MSAAIAGAALAGCVSAEYRREIVHEPIARERLSALEPGVSDLGACLAALGAPAYVWEHSGDGLALGYGWYRHAHWGVGASYQLSRGVTASMNYDDIDAVTRGYVLFFDGTWKLTAVRSGYLRDLTQGLGRRRPAADVE